MGSSAAFVERQPGSEHVLACEIYGVTHKNSVRWKWRHASADGEMQACPEEYALLLECVAAARAGGYEPRSSWTGPCASLVSQDSRPSA
jgi:hypothetical protein